MQEVYLGIEGQSAHVARLLARCHVALPPACNQKLSQALANPPFSEG